MLFCPVLAVTHSRLSGPPPRLCVLGELCVKIPPSRDSHSCTSPKTSSNYGKRNSFQISGLRTLSFSVSSKSFACHSYENCRVCTNNSHSGTRHSPLITPTVLKSFLFIFLRTLLHAQKSQPFCFQVIPHSLRKNTRGVGVFPSLKPSNIQTCQPSPIRPIAHAQSWCNNEPSSARHRQARETYRPAPVSKNTRADIGDSSILVPFASRAWVHRSNVGPQQGGPSNPFAQDGECARIRQGCW